MKTNASKIELLFEKAEDYTKTSVDLAKLTIIDKSADVLSSLMSQIAVAVVVAIVFTFINIGLSLWIGEMIGKSYYGFFIIAGANFIIAILLYSYKNQLIKIPVSNTIITKLLKKS